MLLDTAELEKMSLAAKSYSTEHQGATKKILAALDQ
jgi:3-deoxy-D-manno-octulosonic-acid transferase